MHGFTAHDSALLVAESGIHTRADVVRLANWGVRVILVGEGLMKHRDIQDGVRELIAIDHKRVLACSLPGSLLDFECNLFN
ncbi:MAG: hypothetical protein HY298_21715 [Verrucomicrobia bacterium]|nr:hypothetical protein [Verrucomicrobiota bacterium]